MKKQALILALLLLSTNLQGQDTQYSQFYANPLYLNPALTGSTGMTRVGVNYRNQWPALNQSILSYSAFLDHYIPGANSGIGLIFNRSQQSARNLNTTEVGATYAYRARLGQKSYIRMGAQVSYVDRDAFFGGLIFGNQIDDQTGSIIGDSGENLNVDFDHQFVDYSLGFLFHSEHFWLGAAAFHVTEPNTSFLDGEISQLPVRLAAHGGVSFDLPSGGAQTNPELAMAFNYTAQGPFSKLDLGAQVNFQPLVFGLWYRGIPVFQNTLPNHESLIGLLGISLTNGMDFGYSYDFTLSALGNANTGGAHEVSFRYTFLSKASNKSPAFSALPCFRY